jgi:hypothetical protein
LSDPLIEAFKKGLPDCRPRIPRAQIRTPYGLATPIACANCGNPAGYAFGNVEHLFYLCDRCDHHGTGLDLPVVDLDRLSAAAKEGGG